MNKSQSISEITKALIMFHSKVENLKKDAINPFFKSAYCTLDNIINTIEAPLNASGLTFAQFPSGNNGLTTILLHESGEWMESEYFMQPVKNDPQGTGSVITYARRYALAAILGLSVDVDDDANAATHGGKTPEQAEENNKPWLNKGTKEYAGAIKKLQTATTTIEKIEKVFKLSKTIRQELLAAKNGVQQHAN